MKITSEDLTILKGVLNRMNSASQLLNHGTTEEEVRQAYNNMYTGDLSRLVERLEAAQDDQTDKHERSL